MKRSVFIEKKRKIISWLVVFCLGALILFSKSRWEGGYPLSDILFLTGIFLVSIATVGRLWCSLYICGYKTNSLITAGPYSICRNPLYFFSLLGGIGIGMASETLTVTIIIVIAFSIYYPLVIASEEAKLRSIHGEAFDQYIKQTPRFWPSLSKLYEPDEYTVRPKVFRRAVFDALWFIWIAGILELIEALHEYNIVKPVFCLY